MPVVDLSHSIHPKMPLYPGSKATELSSLSTIDEIGYREQRLHLNTHSGTHLDAPAHMIVDGKTIDQFPVGYFVGSACVVDCTGIKSGIIDQIALAPYQEELAASKFVLLHTAWSDKWGSKDYFDGYPVLSQQASKWLCQFGLNGIGLDSISIDHPTSTEFPNHLLMLNKEILIIENLRSLNSLPRSYFTLFCQPLPIQGGDGAPVRVIAVY